jgi:hypothetical protein
LIRYFKVKKTLGEKFRKAEKSSSSGEVCKIRHNKEFVVLDVCGQPSGLYHL